MPELLVETKSLASLLNDDSLIIPYYQRPYTWTEKQVEPLMNDLFKAGESQSLIMGSLILHHNEEGKSEIVDGQQRLTTFAILNMLNGTDTGSKIFDFKYPHEVSRINIRNNASFIKKFIEKKGRNRIKISFDNIYFIVVYAPDLDDAFSFFDSQNTRGKKLEDYDILKAHHLRYIESDHLSEHCAIKWEGIQRDEQVDLKLLLETILGRGRKWSRKEYKEIDIKKEFKSQRTEPAGTASYMINKYQQPPVFSHWKYDPLKENGLELLFGLPDAIYKINGLQVNGDPVKFLPFQINQSIEGGELFFWYTQKYYGLYREIFLNNEDTQSEYFRKLISVLKSFKGNIGTNYVYEVFIGSVLFYADKFGYEKFDEVVTMLFFCCYYLRFKRQTVQYNSIYKYVRETDGFNPFAIISRAGFPDYIIGRAETFLEGKYTPGEINAGGIRGNLSNRLFLEGEGVFDRFSQFIPPILNLQYGI